MKKLLLFLLWIGISNINYAQSFSIDSCITSGSSGNIAIFANYDGGVLNINVDQNIPNLKIGVCTYEPVTIVLSGPYVNNVTEVRYAGYVSTNNYHCSNSPSTTTIVGAPVGATTSVLFLPPATLSNPNGYSSILCAYSCSTTSNQGGCNTADQIQHYFETTMNGTAFMSYIQYGCWSTSAYSLSAGGTCPLPIVNDTTVSAFSSSATGACLGSSLSFTDLSPNAVSWTWSAPGSTVPTSNTQHLTGVVYNTAGTYTVTLTVNDGDGTCSTSQIIEVFPRANLNETATPNPLCEGDSALLQVSAAQSYSWLPGGPTSSDWTVSPVTNTWYYVNAIDTNGCSVNDSLLVIVFPEPSAPSISLLGGTLFVNPFNGTSYQWYLNGSPITGADSASFTPTTNGDYTVSYTDANGCESVISLPFTVDGLGAGIDEHDKNHIRLFPNPTTDLLTIDLGENTEGVLYITDAIGKTIMQRVLNQLSIETIDVNTLKAGVYFVVIHTDAKVYRGSFVKE